MRIFYKNKKTGDVVTHREKLTNGLVVSGFNKKDLIPNSEKTFISSKELDSEWEMVDFQPEGDHSKNVEKDVLGFIKNFILDCFDYGITEEDKEGFCALRAEKFVEEMLSDKRFNSFDDLLRDFASRNFPEEFADDIKHQENSLLRVLWDQRQNLKVLLVKISGQGTGEG